MKATLPAALALAAMLSAPADADARGIMLITHGDQIRELVPKPGAPGSKLQQGLKVGYLNSYGGVFWLDFWTWGGGYCVYKPDNQGCEAISPTAAAKRLGVPESELPEPFFYRFPLGLFILFVGGVLFGILALFGAIATRREDAKAADLLAEPLYQDMLAVPEGRWQHFLVSKGVPEREAAGNVRVLKSVRARQAGE